MRESLDSKLSGTSKPLKGPSASELILAQLEERGLGLGSLKTDWQVVLWRVKVKRGGLKLKLHPLGPVDEAALHLALQQALGGDIKLSLKFSEMSTCCGSQCEGCLLGNPDLKVQWLAPLLEP
ncbi:hypothetical protein [Vampirovibrio sp.]|uniref:hypothetical protein n=1 Tax=Vampirovibrio sp. TaxID=2717857 RepID=UPI0035940E8D